MPCTKRSYYSIKQAPVNIYTKCARSDLQATHFELKFALQVINVTALPMMNTVSDGEQEAFK